ncbi:hypothetical protein LTR53_012071 [Teratosphaeriaceae sp. CCFEE 6253]|nr:hypothetical protein LTR53_012071 [Teratosphaeriaceae sp. CCFEE 6253]
MPVNTTCPIPAGSEDYGVRGTAWHPIVWAALACTIATVAIALPLIALHLRRYRVPKEQRQIIRLVFCVVVYSVVAFFEVYSYETARYIDPIGDLYVLKLIGLERLPSILANIAVIKRSYEAFGLCALYLLYVQYAAPSGTFNDDTFAAVKAAEEIGSNFDWPRISYIFVFQYPNVEILCVMIIEASEATGTYCTNSLDPWFGHLWVQILQSIGIGFCVVAILKFRGNMKQRMKVRRGLAKLGAFKIIVAIRFMQAWIFSLLLQYEVIKPSATFSYNDVLWGVPGLATCAEMVLFSLAFWYAFSSTEYGSNAKPRDPPLPLGTAVLHAINPWDLFVGVARIFPLWSEVHRNGDWAKWRAARSNSGLIGLFKRRFGKSRSTCTEAEGSNFRYQETSQGLEELKRPTNAHHSRSGSAQSDTEYARITGLGGHQLYEPPSGSPPDEASSFLVPHASPHASQAQWNGQRYDRSPSPRGRRSVDATSGRDMV